MLNCAQTSGARDMEESMSHPLMQDLATQVFGLLTGVLRIPGEKKNVRTHVYAWTLENGPVPAGLFVLHQCDNRACVRASHLFTGTHQDNMKDMAAKGRAKGLTKIHLSPVEKDRMWADYLRGGFTYNDLAVRYGVSLQTVGRTLRGESN